MTANTFAPAYSFGEWRLPSVPSKEKSGRADPIGRTGYCATMPRPPLPCPRSPCGEPDGGDAVEGDCVAAVAVTTDSVTTTVDNAMVRLFADTSAIIGTPSGPRTCSAQFVAQ